MAKLVIRHDLETLTKDELTQYLRDVSKYIGLDPDLNALDAIYMPNESGNGQSLVVYARRGTAEILRNQLGIEVDSLTSEVIDGSIVYTAKGHNTHPDTGRPWRTEIAIGSKYIKGLEGKIKDDAIMTASTRALRRLTMQFTTLGILDESEVNAVKNEAPLANPAAGAALAANPTPAIFTQPTVPANNAPGKPVEKAPAAPVLETVINHEEGAIAHVKPLSEAPSALGEPFVGQKDQIDAAWKQVNEKAAKRVADEAATEPAKTALTPAVSTTSEEINPATEVAEKAARPKRARKAKNTVSLDVEPEVVSAKQAVSTPVETVAPVETTPEQEVAAVEAFLKPVPAPASVPVEPPAPVAGMPTKEQMDNYRAKVGVYTQQLPASADLGSVQKMRAFITHWSGTPPQNMTVVQWETQIAWFDEFVGKNGVKGLVKYINDTLGVK